MTDAQRARSILLEIFRHPHTQRAIKVSGCFMKLGKVIDDHLGERGHYIHSQNGDAKAALGSRVCRENQMSGLIVSETKCAAPSADKT